MIVKDMMPKQISWTINLCLVALSQVCHNRQSIERCVMWCRGIRGATVLAANTREEVLQATRELLEGMVKSNGVEKEDVACVLFTTTADINAEFPALAARQMGWNDVALLCSQEVEVPESLSRCVRILMLHNTTKKSDEIVHVYLRGAEVLRQTPGMEAKT